MWNDAKPGKDATAQDDVNRDDKDRDRAIEEEEKEATKRNKTVSWADRVSDCEIIIPEGSQYGKDSSDYKNEAAAESLGEDSTMMGTGSQQHQREDVPGTEETDIQDTVSSAALARYPILKLKLRTNLSTELVMDILLRTNDALERFKRVRPHDIALATVSVDISQFIQSILGDESSMLTSQRRWKLWSLRQSVLRVVSPVVRSRVSEVDEAYRDFGRILQALSDVLDKADGNDSEDSQRSGQPPKSQSRTFYQLVFFPRMKHYLLLAPSFQLGRTQYADIERSLNQIISYFRGDQSILNTPSSEQDVMNLMKRVLQKCEDFAPQKLISKSASPQCREEKQGESVQDSKREASSLMGTHAQLTSPSRSGENSRTPADGCDSESQSQKQNPAPDPAIVLRRKKIREAMGPKYVQLLVLAKGLEYILPRYPDLESLIILPFYEERKLCDLMEEDEEAVLAKVNVIRTELGTYEDQLLEAFEKLQAYPEEEQPQNLSEEKTAQQKPLQLLSQGELKERLRFFCQSVRRKTMLESIGGCQETWKQIERECESLYPDGVQFEIQDGVSALTKTRGHLYTRLQAVSEAARRSCLLEERVQLVSSQAERLRSQLVSPDMSADLPSCRVRFLRIFQRLLFLTAVCSLMAQ